MTSAIGQHPLIGVFGAVSRQAKEDWFPALLANGARIGGVAGGPVDDVQRTVDEYGPRGKALQRAGERGYKVSEEAARQFAKVDVYGTLDEMLDAVDLVVISGPRERHATEAIKALERKHGVLVESPISTAAKQRKDLLRAGRNRVLGAGYPLPWRLRPSREMIVTGRCDRVGEAGLYWERKGEVPGGDGLFDVARHCVSAVLQLFDSKPLRVRGRTDIWSPADDLIIIQIEFADGRNATVRVSSNSPLPAGEEELVLVIHDGPKVKRRLDPEIDHAAGMVRLTQNWIQACIGSEQLAFALDRAVNTERVMAKVAPSASQPGPDGWGRWLNVR